MRNSLNIDEVIAALRSVLPTGAAKVSLHEPQFDGNEWCYVKECIDSRWVSSVGAFVDRFEDALAAYTGVKRAVAVVNGTAALHICLKLAGVEKGDEVLVPAFSFVATANAVAYCGAVPHFVEIDEHTLGLDPIKLEKYLREITEIRLGGCFNKLTGRRIRAVVPMHTFGHSADIDPITDICHYFRLDMVEDAAESLGTFYKGKHTGSFGRVSALSFNGNKIVTTGGGGAILTNDEQLGNLAKHLTTTAKLPHRWEFNHDMIGYNYRLPNINAALGCAQMEELPGFLSSKRLLAESYSAALAGIDGIRFFTEPEFSRSNYWLNTIVMDEELAGERDALLAATNDAGIMTRPAWTPLHRLPMYENCPRMILPVTESLVRRAINIPSSACLGEPYVKA